MASTIFIQTMQWLGDVGYAYASNQSISVVVVLVVVEVLSSLRTQGKIYDGKTDLG